MHRILRALVRAVIAMALLAQPIGSLADTPAPTATPSPSGTPNALDTALDVDGMPFTVRDLIHLMSYAVLVYTPAGAHPSSVLVTKAQSDMPAYDPDIHYVSYAMQNGQAVLTIWQTERFARAGGSTSIQPMMSTAILGVLDAGLAPPSLQALYKKEQDADVALGPTAPNPILHRRQMSDQLATMIINLMEMLRKKSPN